RGEGRVSTKMIQDHDVPRCNQIKVNGVRCGSPALRQKELCYLHNRLNRLTLPPAIPFLEDGNAIQFALSQVIEAVLEDRLDHKRASLLIYSLQVAAYNLRTGQVNFGADPATMVREDPADNYFEEAMKRLPQNASVDQVLKVIKTNGKA